MKSSQLVRFIAAYRDQPLKEKKPKIQERVQFSKTVDETHVLFIFCKILPHRTKNTLFVTFY